MVEDYWLYRWLEENQVDSAERAMELLSDLRLYNQVKDTAAEWWNGSRSIQVRRTDLLPGAGLDLAGPLSCSSPSCRRQEVDVLFRHAWHYFDRILLPDGTGAELLYGDTSQRDGHLNWLYSHISVALYLKKIGAVRLIEYIPRIPPLALGKLDISADPMLAGLIQNAPSLIDSIFAEAKITLNAADDEWVHYDLEHPETQIILSGVIDVRKKRRTETEMRTLATHNVFDFHLRHLIYDLLGAKKLGTAFASTDWIARQILPVATPGPDIPDVAFSLELPFLRSVPLPELIALRQSEQESFERFRDSLTKATKERLSQGNSLDPGRVAAEIQNDLIEPELRQIRAKLMAAERVFAKKSALAITLSTLGTTCGLIAGLAPPMAAGAGVGTLLTLFAAGVSKMLDDNAQASLSDMYFLWKALEHAE